MKPASPEVRRAADRADDAADEVGRERVDHRAERRPDDDRDGQVDDVAAHDEVPESLEHGRAFAAGSGYPWTPAPVAQWIERSPPEREVASSNLAGRVAARTSRRPYARARVDDHERLLQAHDGRPGELRLRRPSPGLPPLGQRHGEPPPVGYRARLKAHRPDQPHRLPSGGRLALQPPRRLTQLTARSGLRERRLAVRDPVGDAVLEAQRRLLDQDPRGRRAGEAQRDPERQQGEAVVADDRLEAVADDAGCRGRGCRRGRRSRR